MYSLASTQFTLFYFSGGFFLCFARYFGCHGGSYWTSTSSGCTCSVNEIQIWRDINWSSLCQHFSFGRPRCKFLWLLWLQSLYFVFQLTLLFLIIFFNRISTSPMFLYCMTLMSPQLGVLMAAGLLIRFSNMFPMLRCDCRTCQFWLYLYFSYEFELFDFLSLFFIFFSAFSHNTSLFKVLGQKAWCLFKRDWISWWCELGSFGCTDLPIISKRRSKYASVKVF